MFGEQKRGGGGIASLIGKAERCVSNTTGYLAEQEVRLRSTTDKRNKWFRTVCINRPHYTSDESVYFQ